MQNDPKINDVLLDRLVDGEMADGEYRRLLHQLEEQPDGWRRCALSFLEQQALQRELKQIMASRSRFDADSEIAEAAEGREPEQVVIPAASHWNQWMARPLVRWTSVVAVGVLAFVGGVALRPDLEVYLPIPAHFAQRDVAENEISPTMVAVTPASADIWIDDPLDGSRHEINVPVQTIAAGQPLAPLAPDHVPRSLSRALEESKLKNLVERGILLTKSDEGDLVILTYDRIIPLDDFQ